jgi:hypothetical protein
LVAATATGRPFTHPAVFTQPEFYAGDLWTSTSAGSAMVQGGSYAINLTIDMWNGAEVSRDIPQSGAARDVPSSYVRCVKERVPSQP